MIEIKREMVPAVEAKPAVEAQPQRVNFYSATRNERTVEWGPSSAIHLFGPDWYSPKHEDTPQDFREFAALLLEIAESMEKANGK